MLKIKKNTITEHAVKTFQKASFQRARPICQKRHDSSKTKAFNCRKTLSTFGKTVSTLVFSVGTLEKTVGSFDFTVTHSTKKHCCALKKIDKFGFCYRRGGQGKVHEQEKINVAMDFFYLDKTA